MSAAAIFQLLSLFGPPALQMIEDLIALWSKPSLSVDEVLAFTKKSRKSYEDYMADAKATQPPP